MFYECKILLLTFQCIFSNGFSFFFFFQADVRTFKGKTYVIVPRKTREKKTLNLFAFRHFQNDRLFRNTLCYTIFKLNIFFFLYEL